MLHKPHESFRATKMSPNFFFKQLATTDAPHLPGEKPLRVETIKQQHGTTTLGFIFKGGIILSVDSRSTMGGYISSNNVKKVLPITDKIMATITGGAADCEFWERDLSRNCKQFEFEHGVPIGVSAASKLFNSVLHQYSGYDLSVGSMISGFDADGSPHIYYCDNEGNRLEGQLFSVGSGSTFAYSILETGYHWDMTKEEAIELGLNAVMHATHRDAMSGGMQNVFLITPEKWELVKR